MPPVRARAGTLVLVLLAVSASAAIETRSTAEALGGVSPKPSRGCSAASTVPPGAGEVGTTSGGAARTYLRHVPPAYDGRKPLPLVIDLHGYLEGARLHETNSMLGAFGDAHRFVTLTPEGMGPPAHFDVELDSPDVRFIGDVIDETNRSLCVDRRRIFVAGYSNGAFLASVLACVYSDRIAAIAPVAGLVDPKGCEPKRPVPVVTFHGTADEFVSYTGGLGPRGMAASALDGTDRTLAETSGGRVVARRASTPKVVAAWVERNGCAARVRTKTVAADVTRVSYGCPKDAEVVLYRIDGAGHTWPGSAFSKAIEAAVGPTTLSIDANAVMWDFFRAHPLR